eukprot:TRINITY_DN896_c0_g1_i4.p1 TRINITY_DN896_c0_g1~~TRINITY_DN896_c0_g1_i4.p1  ORF type:complete len:1558 (-),score=465.23 TRINITY_DN896_c0_g1_i4:2150-6823(-)
MEDTEELDNEPLHVTDEIDLDEEDEEFADNHEVEEDDHEDVSKCWLNIAKPFLMFPRITLIVFLILPFISLSVLTVETKVDVSLDSFTIKDHIVAIRNTAAATAREKQGDAIATYLKDHGINLRRAVNIFYEDGDVEEDDDDAQDGIYLEKRSIEWYNYRSDWILHVIFQLNEQSTRDTVFSSDILSFCRDVSNKITSLPDYSKYCWKDRDGHCALPNSILPYFFKLEDKTDSRQISIGHLENYPPSDIEGGVTNLLLAGEYQYTSNNFSRTNPKSTSLRIEFTFGTPLEGFTGPDDQTKVQYEVFKTWLTTTLVSYLNEVSERPDLGIEVFHGGNGITQDEILATVFKDTTFAFASMVIILFLMWFHMESFGLALLSLYEIVSSFGIAIFIYRLVFGISQVGAMNAIGIFLILGIGVDDIFIFYNTFCQSSHIQDPVRRLAVTYKNSAKATFITSFTTAAAFISNLFSPIPALRWFGIWMALLVVINYLLVLTLFPTAMIVWDTYWLPWWKSKNCCSSCSLFGGLKQIQTKIFSKMSQNYDRLGQQNDQVSSDRFTEYFFAEYFSPLLNKSKYFWIVICVVVAAISIGLATQLQPSKDVAGFFPKEHNIQRFLDWQALGTLDKGVDLRNIKLGCDGKQNSGKVVDACGVCGGDGSTCASGCDGKPGSNKVFDECGVCGGPGGPCPTNAPVDTPTNAPTNPETPIDATPVAFKTAKLELDATASLIAVALVGGANTPIAQALNIDPELVQVRADLISGNKYHLTIMLFSERNQKSTNKDLDTMVISMANVLTSDAVVSNLATYGVTVDYDSVYITTTSNVRQKIVPPTPSAPSAPSPTDPPSVDTPVSTPTTDSPTSPTPSGTPVNPPTSQTPVNPPSQTPVNPPPTDAPIDPPPTTASPVNPPPPTDSPVNPPPSDAPVNPPPTDAPINPPPSDAPVNPPPSDAPINPSPPSDSPVNPPPSDAPVNPPPTTASPVNPPPTTTASPVNPPPPSDTPTNPPPVESPTEGPTDAPTTTPTSPPPTLAPTLPPSSPPPTLPPPTLPPPTLPPSNPPVNRGGCDGNGGVFDQCGVCAGNGESCLSGCDHLPFSNKTYDKCGVCGGNNSCVGCDGVQGSTKKNDLCGVCGGNNECLPDNKPQLRGQRIDIYWGINGVDTSQYDANDPFAKYHGEPVWDTSFSMDATGSHEFFVNLCNTVKQRSDLVMKDENEHYCVISDFDQYLKSTGRSVPTGSSYTKELLKYIKSAGLYVHMYDIAFQSLEDSATTNRVLYLRFRFQSLMSPQVSSAEGLEWYNKWEDMLQQLKNTAPYGVGNSGFSYTSVWVRVFTEHTMVVGILASLSISTIIVLLSLIIFIGNIFIPLVAILCIIFTVGCLLGLFWALGWSIGALEAISVSIMVGLSCDYIFHMADAYNRAKSNPKFETAATPQEQRYLITKNALWHMGVSILGGATTTAVSSAMLLNTTILIFYNFGILVTATIIISLFFTLFFFTSIMIVIGPRGTYGDFWFAAENCFMKVYRYCRPSSSTSDDYESVEVSTPAKTAVLSVTTYNESDEEEDKFL